MTDAPDNSAYAATLRTIHADAAGVMSLTVILPSEAPGLLLDSLCGNREAAILLHTVQHAIRNIRTAPRKRPQLCVSCPRPIGPRLKCSFVVATPHKDNPAGAVAMAVCHRCATRPSEVQSKALEGLKRLWPDLYPFSVTHRDGGRA
jgi:hypothetical protein